MHSVERAFPGDVASVAAARRFVSSVLADLGFDHLVDAAALLTSELVSNAVLHTRSAPTVRVVSDDPCVKIEVHDRSAMMPARKRYGLDAATGRGLLLIETLALDWNAELTEAGKRVWFTLDISDATDPLLELHLAGAAAELDAEVDLDALAAQLGEGGGGSAGDGPRMLFV